MASSRDGVDALCSELKEGFLTNRQTPLHQFHIDNHARMVPFAGWDMPVQYAHGIKAEHLATRASAGLFDVSHMAQISLSGTDAEQTLERITPTDLPSVTEGRMRYSVFLNEAGGVLDDLIISRLDGTLRLVVNAGRAAHDIAFLQDNLIGDTQMVVEDNRALLALQGPNAEAVLSSLGADLSQLYFMQIAPCQIAGFDCVIMRSGYTGEDGFEISLAAQDAPSLAETLNADDAVTLAGLGARDTLRIEAGLPLWGHELDDTINPVEAGLGFAISKRRREAQDFAGAAPIMTALQHGTSRYLTGILPTGQRPVRDGAILECDGEVVGHISSGGFSPSLGKPAALGFVKHTVKSEGQILQAVTNGRSIEVVTATLPLIPHRYKRPPRIGT